MFNNHIEIKKLERKITKLEKEIPDETDIRILAEKVLKEREEELNDVYEERMKARAEVFDYMKEHIDAYAKQYLESIIDEKTKDIQDKLIVELARKAMNMEEK